MTLLILSKPVDGNTSDVHFKRFLNNLIKTGWKLGCSLFQQQRSFWDLKIFVFSEFTETPLLHRNTTRMKLIIQKPVRGWGFPFLMWGWEQERGPPSAPRRLPSLVGAPPAGRFCQTNDTRRRSRPAAVKLSPEARAGAAALISSSRLNFDFSPSQGGTETDEEFWRIPQLFPPAPPLLPDPFRPSLGAFHCWPTVRFDRVSAGWQFFLSIFGPFPFPARLCFITTQWQ